MDRRIESVVAILFYQWRRPIRIGDLAAAVDLCPSHLEHLFKAEMHCSITEFVMDRRLEAAARAIAETHERISSICFAVGFTDPSNFNHAFKKRYGVSPREFRRSHAFADLTK